jgi:hypothetical protein
MYKEVFMSDRFVRGCWVVIVLLLMIIASRPNTGSCQVQAAGKIEYEILEVKDGYSAKVNLNNMAANGWELVAATDKMLIIAKK